jgi:hypothetical protein
MKIKENISLKNKEGAVIIIVALSLTAIMMVTALAIDVGSLYRERRNLQTVADSAALAGAQELPESPEGAANKAYDYAEMHGVASGDIEVTISDTLTSNDTIAVISKNPESPLYFARVMGKDSSEVVAAATAIVASPEGLSGIVPWGVQEGMWEPGEEVVLKYGAIPGSGGEWSGNFQALALDKPGANEYRDNIKYGCDTVLSVGDIVDTQTGNVVGPTDKGADFRIYNLPNYAKDSFEDLTKFENGAYSLAVPDSQFVMVPVIPELTYATGKTEVEILYFVPFIITEIINMNGDPEYGNGVAILGRFLDSALAVTEGSIIPAQEFGIRVIRLVK